MDYTPPVGIGYWKDKNRNRWKVRVGKKFLGTSTKPYARFFSTEKEAVKWMRGITKKQSGDFESAEELQITKHQMAEVRIAFKRIGDTSLLEIVEHWEKTKKNFITSPLVEDAITKLIELKKLEENGARHIEELEGKLRAMLKDHLQSNIATLTYDQMVAVVSALAGKKPTKKIPLQKKQTPPSPSQKAKRVRYLNILFNFALTQSWIAKSPMLAFGKTTTKLAPVFVLSPVDVAKLIHHCELLQPALLPSILIKCFSGVRNSELFQLRWENVGDEIIVPAAFSKTQRERKVTITNILNDWLTKLKGKPADLVCPLPSPTKGKSEKWTRRPNLWYKRIRPVADAAGIKPWPQNALRHLFGSYHLALFKDEGKTAYEMGNSVGVVRRNYTNAVKETACDSFWGLYRAEVDRLVKAQQPEPEGEALGPRTRDVD